MPDKEIFDTAVFWSAYDLLGAEQFEENLEAALIAIRGLCEDLHSNAKDNPSDLARALHQQRGVGLLFGMSKVAQHLLNLELALSDTGKFPTSEDLATLDAALYRTKAAVKALLATRDMDQD